MSLANKYRPKDFDTIVGQDHITDILKAQIKSDQKINHNFLLFGPRGTGKTTAARILAKALNCLDLKDGNPCNQCANCQTINESKTLDYVEIDAASHTGVDNIREEILDKVSYPPTQLKKKIYVIDEVHMLSKGAFNALLKTIEEPKDNVCFILATTEINKVPDTIVSRCQVFNFKKVGEENMTKRLQYICDQETLKYDPEALKVISKISEWCVRDAVKYVDQVSIFGDLNQENVSKFLGIANDSVVKDFLDLIKNGDRNKVFEKVDEINDQGIDLIQFAKQCIMYIDNNLNSNIDFLLFISEAFWDILAKIRFYPYPTMIYKIVLNKYIGNEQWTINSEQPTSIDKNPVVKPTANGVSQIEEQNKKNPEPETNIQQEDNNIDPFLQKLINKIDSGTIKWNLQNHTILKNIGENEVELIVINKMTDILFKKDDNKKILENAIFDVLGKNMAVIVEYQSKEDYFANQL